MQPDMLYNLIVLRQKELEETARRQRRAHELKRARRLARSRAGVTSLPWWRRSRPTADQPAPSAA